MATPFPPLSKLLSRLGYGSRAVQAPVGPATATAPARDPAPKPAEHIGQVGLVAADPFRVKSPDPFRAGSDMYKVKVPLKEVSAPFVSAPPV